MKTLGAEIWDVCVVGGGPAGMMAAARAAETGAKVILLERNNSLGKKLLITGGGRCNVTNAEFDTKKLLAKFRDGGKFLASPFSQWSARETIDFFEGRGMPTKVQAENRAFPVSDTAQSVWDVLVAYLKETGVTVLSNSRVESLNSEDGRIVSAQLKYGDAIRAKAFVLATGGLSHPETGSTGDGFRMLRDIGHTVNDTEAALVPLALKKPLVGAAGVSLRDVKITVYQNNAKQAQGIGKMLFTHVGLSGPAILNLSREIGELLKYGEVEIEIDLLPEQGFDVVDAKLQQLFRDGINKKIRNVLGTMVQPSLVASVLEYAAIDSDTQCNSVTREARVRLMRTLKHLRLEVAGLLGLDKAITTSGGVALTEVDFKTMASKKFPNLYLVGDMLDIDRPSGGYSLQICWTSGYVAGTSAAAIATR
ncbi:MAG: flavoprotein [Candidatus Kaiserbacteria bacterium]|nr:flavoprotein [Candidatus Kaiserbacteria bacterium]